MRPLRLNSPGPWESIAPNCFSEFDLEVQAGTRFVGLIPFSPQSGYISTKIEIRSKKRVPDRILKNGSVLSIPESLENSTSEGAAFERNSKTFFTIPYDLDYATSLMIDHIDPLSPFPHLTCQSC